MTGFLQWLSDNATTIFAVLFALHGAALAIVNATATPADDRIVGKFYKFLEALAGIFSSKAKQLPGEKQWESSR